MYPWYLCREENRLGYPGKLVMEVMVVAAYKPSSRAIVSNVSESIAIGKTRINVAMWAAGRQLQVST
jgi:hypothetical protein